MPHIIDDITIRHTYNIAIIINIAGHIHIGHWLIFSPLPLVIAIILLAIAFFHW